MYPKIKLDVTVSHYEGTPRIFPTQLYITETDFDISRRPEREESYFKSDNGNIVRCSKLENGMVYHKTQTFEKEMEWLEGHHPTRRNIFKPLSAPG